MRKIVTAREQYAMLSPWRKSDDQRTALRYELPPRGAIKVTRHRDRDAGSIAQEILDQDGPAILWKTLKETLPGQKIYLARDKAGTIHGLLKTQETPNFHFVSDLYSSLKAPPGTGNHLLRTFAKDAHAKGKQLAVADVMNTARPWWEAMGANFVDPNYPDAEPSRYGSWSPEAHQALIAGDTLGVPNSPAPREDGIEEVPRQMRMPGSAREYSRRQAASGDPTLPLGVRDSRPAPLYRGVVLDLTHPDAAIVRRSLLGNSFEDYHAPDEGRFAPCRGCPHPGPPPQRPPGPGDGVQGAFPWGRDFSDQALATTGKHRWDRMGQDVLDLTDPGDDTEWTDDPTTAEKVALEGKRNALRLPVVLSRSSPHAAISSVRILHPQNGHWHEILPPGSDRTAALAKTLVDHLEDEFTDWWDQTGWGGKAGIHGIRSWPHVEEFLKDRYPAAHRGLSYGFEEARPLLDWDWRHPDEDPGQLQRYQTGPEAIAQHGYDPKEIAAAMLLLHQESDPARADLGDEDQQRLVDIAEKRTRMQRDYERRQS